MNVTFDDDNTQRTKAITIDVVEINYPYNAIFGRNTLVKFAAVIHQPYLYMKLPIAGRVITVFGNWEEARRCEDNMSYANRNVHAIEVPGAENTEVANGETQELGGVSLAEHTKKVPLCEDVPDQMVTIGRGLEEAEEARLIQFLRNNQDVFAWSSSDLWGISHDVMEHTLKVYPKARPVK